MLDIIYHINKICIFILLFEQNYKYIFLFILFNLTTSKYAQKDYNLILTCIVIFTTYYIYYFNNFLYRLIIISCIMFQSITRLNRIHEDKIFVWTFCMLHISSLLIIRNSFLIKLFVIQSYLLM